MFLFFLSFPSNIPR